MDCLCLLINDSYLVNAKDSFLGISFGQLQMCQSLGNNSRVLSLSGSGNSPLRAADVPVVDTHAYVISVQAAGDVESNGAAMGTRR